jgi:hypothetical protein
MKEGMGGAACSTIQALREKKAMVVLLFLVYICRQLASGVH